MRFLYLLIISLLLFSCGSKTSSTLPQEKSDECLFQDEVCSEAHNFQNEYSRMSDEEQEKMTVVLNSYIEHCEKAKKECKKSMR